MNRILTQHGETKKIAALFNVDRRTVWLALNGTYESDLVKRIRKIAIDRGGLEMVNNSLKNNNNESTN